MSRGNAKLEVGQLVLTSSTPPGNLGLYAYDQDTIGVVGDLVCIDPKSKAESSVVTSTVDPVTGRISITGPGNYRKVVYPNVSVAIGVAPSVTWNNTAGGFTSPTSLGVTYSRGLWLYFNGVGINGTTGGPATSGYYWCVMSSATQGIAYAEKFNPEIGAVPNLVTSTTPLVTVIGTNAPTLNTYITAAKVTIAGGSIGANGILKGHDFLSYSNSANNKYASVLLGNEFITSPSGLSSSVSARREYWMYNRGAEDSNFIQTYVYLGTTTGQPTLASINTAVDQSLVYALHITAATDFLILNSAALSSENTQ